MPYVPSEIVNMALGHLGSELTVVNYTTDNSPQAAAARTYFNLAVGKMLDDVPWPFATVFAPLVIVDWFFSRERHFAYAYPPNCRFIRRLFSPSGHNRNDDVQSRQKYKIIQSPNPNDSNQLVKVILADRPNLQVEYTLDTQDTSQFSDNFCEALSFLLAFYMAPRLTGGDPYKLGDRAWASFIQSLKTAETLAFNEQVDDDPRLGEFIDQRQGHWRHGHTIEEWFALPSGTPIQ